MAVVAEDNSRDEAVVTEAAEVNNEVVEAAKVDISHKRQVFQLSHSTHRAAHLRSEATMVVEVLVGVAATITSMVAAAMKERQASQIMAEMVATITSTSLGSSTMSSTGRASSTKVAAAMIASSSTRVSSRFLPG